MEQEARVSIERSTPLSISPINLRGKPRFGENVIEIIVFVCGAISIFTTTAIVIVLFQEAWLFFGSPEVDLAEFFGTTTWQPETGRFGIWPLMTSTLITSIIALMVAVPLGLGAAIYLSEYASPRARGYLKPILEVLAGVPTVVYGYFALTFVTPVILQGLLGIL
jgi:phosphate ABC transporter membrane protein 1, PhoT family (TC 3.A.1.7.1)